MKWSCKVFKNPKRYLQSNGLALWDGGYAGECISDGGIKRLCIWNKDLNPIFPALNGNPPVGLVPSRGRYLAINCTVGRRSNLPEPLLLDSRESGRGDLVWLAKDGAFSAVVHGVCDEMIVGLVTQVKGQQPFPAVWRASGSLAALNKGALSELVPLGTDGKQVVGSSGSEVTLRPVVWASTADKPINLDTGRCAGRATTVFGGTYGGELWVKGELHAAYWASADSTAKILSPKGWERSIIHEMHGGFKVGVGYERERTPFGSMSSASKALIWDEDNRPTDLQRFVPVGFNASRANAVSRIGDKLYVIGSVLEVAGIDDLTRPHSIVRRNGAIWIGEPDD